MERNVEIDKISDGKRYGANDLVKVGCDDCRGCSACCHGMGDSIVLDPMDVYRLEKKLGKTMEEILLAGNVALRVVDGVILPHLKMTEQSDRCSFLNAARESEADAFRQQISMNILKLFYLLPYDGNTDFYTQFAARMELAADKH